MKVTAAITLIVLVAFGLFGCKELTGLSGSYDASAADAIVKTLEFTGRETAIIHLRSGDTRNAVYSIENDQVTITGERGGTMKLKLEPLDKLVSLVGDPIAYQKRTE